MTAAFLAVLSMVAVGGVFVASGLSKVRDLKAFERSVAGFRVLPRGAVAPASRAAVAVELAIPVLMLLWPVGGLGLAVGFLLVLTGVVYSVVRRGIATTCACFGTSRSQVSMVQVWRNAVLVAMAAVGMIASSLAPAGLADAAVVLTATVAGLVVVALVVYVEDLVDLFAGSNPANRS